MIRDLKQIVGDAHVATGDIASRWRVLGVAPTAVVAPATSEQLAQVLAFANARGLAVEPAGAGTYLDSGRASERVDILISTMRMSAVAEYEPADLTISIEAGCSLHALQSRLLLHRQFVALDPPGSVASTVGAVVSRADAGPLRLAHGTPRDHVLGLELVTGDGRVMNLGGRVVKNVAGYDLVKLVVGARGTLGVITQVHLRLRPRPDSDRTFALFSPTPGPLIDIVKAAREVRVAIDAMELLSPALAERTTTHGAWVLLVRVLGSAASVEDTLRRVAALGGGVTGENLTPLAALNAWSTLGAAETDAPLLLRLAARPSDLQLALDLAESLCARIGLDVRLAAHTGDGIVRIVSAFPLPHVDPAALRAVVTEIRSTLEARDGTLIMAAAPSELARTVDPWGAPAANVRVMQDLKRTFDPKRVMAPARFVV